MEQPSSESRTRPPRSHLIPRDSKSWVWIAWFVIAWAAVQWPGWQIANRVEPLVLGIPFMFFWALVWWVLLVVSIILLARKSG